MKIQNKRKKLINCISFYKNLTNINNQNNAYIFSLVIYSILFPPFGLLVSLTYDMNSLATLRATSLFVLMHTGISIVNGYHMLCKTHAVLETHREMQLYFYFSHYCPFPLFLFMCLSR